MKTSRCGKGTGSKQRHRPQGWGTAVGMSPRRGPSSFLKSLGMRDLSQRERVGDLGRSPAAFLLCCLFYLSYVHFLTYVRGRSKLRRPTTQSVGEDVEKTELSLLLLGM